MKKTIITFSFLCFAIILMSCQQTNPNINEDYCIVSSQDKDVYLCEKRITSYFDTTISLKLYYGESDDYDIEPIFTYIEETLEQYHQLFDKYNAYDDIINIYTINHSTEDEIVIDPVLFDAISYALEQESLIQVEGTSLFNIAMNPVLDIWHLARENTRCDTTIELGIDYCPVPSDLIDDIDFPTNPSNILLNDENHTISFREPGMSIDLGGYGKGYVVDVITDYLNTLDIVYILNAGNSNVIAHGENPLNETGHFVIAFTKPSVEFSLVTEYYQYIQIPTDLAVVTSGNYQRFFKDINSGDVYHHIIDPRTNYPGGDCMSVTILYPDSALADIFSTAIYLMTLEEAQTFVNQTPNLEAIWYDYNGDIIYSDGFHPYVYELES